MYHPVNSILKVYLSKDKKHIVFKDMFKSKIVNRKPITEYGQSLLNKLPGYFNCVYCENTVVIRNEAIVVSKDKWNSIPSDYKGEYLDYDGLYPELEGRRTVLGGCIYPHLGSSLLIEGSHFIIV